jgi:4-amino-4-deoxy-L-arabinose transferase-like glycosyltransferase
MCAGLRWNLLKCCRSRLQRDKISLAAVLALAAFLRFWNLDATEFKYDEATVCNLAALFVDTGVPPVRGMGSSVGIDNPPLAVYLISLPVLFSRDPLVASAFVALLNVVAVWGCYQLGRRYWSVCVGLLAALLLASSPWAVFYSRKVWAQDLLSPFVILFFFFLLAWVVDRRAWALSGAIVTLAALTQIHFAALAFVPALALLILIALIQRLRRRQAAPLWKPLGVGVGVSLLLYAPYLVADALAGWRNVRTFVEMMQTRAQIHWETWRFALLNVGGREIHALAGPEQFQNFLAGIVDLGYWPDRIEEALVVIGALYLLARWWRRRRDGAGFRRDGVLILWLVSPILFYMRSQMEVFPHYLIPLYPAPYLALAIAAVDVGELFASSLRTGGAHATGAGRHSPLGDHRGSPLRGWQAVGGLCLAALVAWQSYLSISIHAFVEKHDTPGGMGTPVRIYREVVRTMERHAHAWDNRQAIVLCPGDNPRWHECPAVFRFITGRSLEVRFADVNTALLFPQSEVDTLIVLAPGESIAGLESPTCWGDEVLSRHAQELSGESVPLRAGGGAYRFYRLPAGYVPDPPVRPADTPVRLANGVSLLGYALSVPPEPGQTTRLSLYWRVDSVPADPPAQGYSFANHLLVANGQRCGQKDGPGYPVELWRAGDTVISWFDIALDADAPPGPYQLRVGMYVYTPPDQFVAVPVVDAMGQPIGDAVKWSLE